MRVLFVGGHQFKNDAARYYDYTRKLANGFTKLGHQVLNFSDRDVARMSNIFRSRTSGVKPCNKKLKEFVATYKPDLIIFKHADVILPETLKELKGSYPNMRMAQLNIDALFNPDNVERIKHKSGLVDANFITTYGAALNRVKLNDVPVYYIPNIVDVAVEDGRAFEEENAFDMFFACGAAGENESRIAIPKRIINEVEGMRFSLHVAGLGTGLWGADYMMQLKKVAMGLNLSRDDDRGFGVEEDLYMYSSDRLAHYVGNGLLTFCHRQFSMHELFEEDKEMIFYDSTEDLIEKIKFYKEHDDKRRQIAKMGWQKAHASYSAEKAAAFMIESCFNLPLGEYDWPTKAY